MSDHSERCLDDDARHQQPRGAETSAHDPPEQEQVRPHGDTVTNSDFSELHSRDRNSTKLTPAASPGFQASSFVLCKEQAIWALDNHNAQKFTLILLNTAFDEDGMMGSCVTFAVPKMIAEELTETARPGELPEQSSGTPVVAGSITYITKPGVHSALLNGSSYFLNIPQSPPNQPFITVWTTLEFGKHISSMPNASS